VAPALEAGIAALLRPGSPVRLLPAPIGWREAEDPAAIQARQKAAVPALLAAGRPAVALLALPWPTQAPGLLAGLAVAGLPSLVIAHLAGAAPDALLEPLPPAPALRWAAVSAPVAQVIAATFGLAPGQVEVIRNGVPVPPDDPAARRAARLAKRQALGLALTAPLLVFAGRLEWAKGADLLPTIAARIGAGCGGTLAVLGEGSVRHMLETEAVARPGGPLRVLGQASDVGDWLLAADALLLPSRLEGCPLVFLDAAARRCPVVASADALACYGAAAPRYAALAANGGAGGLTDLAIARLTDPLSGQAQVDAAHRLATAEDEAAMLRRYAALLRTTLA
jgi:glycosyltransferase involved in cell wall biosynthesis